MAAISAPTSIPSVIFGTYISFTGIAGTAVTAGQFLLANKTKGNGYYDPCTVTVANWLAYKPIGVAANSAAVGQEVTIITDGIVNVMNGDDTTTILSGYPVKVGTYVGSVIKCATAGDTVVGVAIDSIVGAGYGRVKLVTGAVHGAGF
jgi:predicted RecA/RadA family phage recombinase